MSKYTYTGKYAAKLGSQLVTIPDKVFHNQRSFHNAAKSFIALRANGRRVRVLLDGDAYGLNSSGTGDPVVRRFRMEDRSIMNDVCEFTTHNGIEIMTRKAGDHTTNVYVKDDGAWIMNAIIPTPNRLTPSAVYKAWKRG